METADGDNSKRLLQSSIKMKQTIFKIGFSAPGLPNKKNTAIAFMPGRLKGWKILTGPIFCNSPLMY